MRHVLAAILLSTIIGCAKPEPPPSRAGYWVEALRAPDVTVRKKAAFTLGNLATTDPAVVPALIGAMKDADAGVRCEAILALMKGGAEAKEAIPILTAIQKRDRDARVCSYAARALVELQRRP